MLVKTNTLMKNYILIYFDKIDFQSNLLVKPFKRTNESFQNKDGSYSTGYREGQEREGGSQH